jgi:hypothetical protein
MSRLLLAFVGVIVASLFLVGERPVKEYFVDASAGQVQVIKAFLKYIQYDKGRILIGFYNVLLINRTRRLRTNGDTTLDKDIARALADEMKERSRWDTFEQWMASCNTAGTPMEDNLIARVASLPVDPINYLLFMNALVTLYREEFALIKNEKPVKWTRREVDEGTAQDNYKAPAKAPTDPGPDMQKYLVDHMKMLDKIWPAIEKISINLTNQITDMNNLLLVREKMPNGFTMRIYVDFEEKVYQKPLADILKFMINNEAQSLQIGPDGTEQMTSENAKIATTLEYIKLSKVDFTPWFVPIYKGQLKTYKERFTTMGFDPGDYFKVVLFCLPRMDGQMKALRTNLKAVENKNMNSDSGEEEGFIGNERTYEYFTSSSHSIKEEDKPFTGPVRDIINRRFAILNVAEPKYKELINACKSLVDEIQKYKDGVSEGKYKLGTDTPLDDYESPFKGFNLKQSLPIGNFF